MPHMNNTSTVVPKLCPLCAGPAKRTFEGMAGYVEGSTYDVYECSNCLTSFIDIKKDLGVEYNIIYGTDPTKDAGYNYYLYLAKASKQLRNPLKDFGNFSAVFWGVVKALKDEKIEKGARVLEIGSGLGYLTHAFNKEGYVCEGLEYSDTAVDFAKKFFNEKHTRGTIENISETHKEKYDVVVATEVIEHVINPNAFVENILKVLKPSGKLILTTPIKDIHPSGTIWETEPAPVHLWWFTEKGIESIAKRFNADTSFVDFTNYTKNKIWHVHLGISGATPKVGPLVKKDGSPIVERKKGVRTRLMEILPAWLYVKMVIFYHDLKFLQRNKPDSRYMYGMCAVVTKKSA